MHVTHTPAGPPSQARLVVLASGSGSTAQALLDASRDPAFGARVVAVGSDLPGAPVLARAESAGVEAFVVPVESDRVAWDAALAERVGGYRPDLVVLAGFMRLVGPAFLARFGGRCVNSHPALSPAFPGTHGPRDALEYGVKVTGCTLFLVDAGVDTGMICAQRTVEVHDDDTVEALHERIKVVEREMLVDTVGRMARNGWTITNRRVHVR
ncbi:MAG: phosphoribosylglycinamide formyltransferase [Actinomycetales bacterium]